QIVWEGVYGMDIASRPTIVWWQACPGGQPNTPCYDEYSTKGDINLIWSGSIPEIGLSMPGTTISATHFSAWLEGNREWILYPGTFAPAAEVNRLTSSAQNA